MKKPGGEVGVLMGIQGAKPLSTNKRGITAGGWGIHINDVKVLNFLENCQKVEVARNKPFFLQIYGIHILVFIFSSTNEASRILNLNLLWTCSNHGTCGTSK